MDHSISYYNKNANDFFERTAYVDLQDIYDDFLPFLPSKAHILDLGCGSGRDSSYFKLQGFDVTALDASEELVKLASSHIGQEVLLMNFQDLDFQDTFDAVWANASLLHVSYKDLKNILEKIYTSLKKEGIFYASFKYGDKNRSVGGREFYDMNEHLIELYLPPLFDLLDVKKSKDTRSQVVPSPDNAWLHVWCKKRS